MGMRITNAQADAAAEHAVASLADRFGGSDVVASVEHHANAHKMAPRIRLPALDGHGTAHTPSSRPAFFGSRFVDRCETAAR